MFEYKIILIKENIEEELNKLGSEGWELIHISFNKYIFKKLIKKGSK